MVKPDFSTQHRVALEYVESIDTEIIEGAVVADIGPGDGFMTKWFLERGANHVCPIDITFENLDDDLRDHDDVTLVEGDLNDTYQRMLFSFDVVWCHHCLEHVPDCIGFLNCIADMLKPRGWLWLAVPNMAPYEVFSPGHIHNFMAPQLLAQLRMAGFDVYTPRIWAKNSQLRVRVQNRSNNNFPEPMQRELETTGRCQASTLDYYNWKAVDRI